VCCVWGMVCMYVSASKRLSSTKAKHKSQAQKWSTGCVKHAWAIHLEQEEEDA